MSATQAVPVDRARGLEEGEIVLWRERRAPPFTQFAVTIAVMVAVVGIAVASFIVTPLLLVAAAAVILLGRRLAARHYLEDQVVTDRRVLVVPRIGEAYGMRLSDIESIEVKGMKAVFAGEAGKLRFSCVRRHRSLKRALQTATPEIPFEQHWDPHCSTCGVRW